MLEIDYTEQNNIEKKESIKIDSFFILKNRRIRNINEDISLNKIK